MALALTLGPAGVGSVRAAATTAIDDAYSVSEDGDLTVNAADGVLNNDTGDGTLCVAQDSIPVNGSIHGGVAADGSFHFTPDPDFNGCSPPV